MATKKIALVQGDTRPQLVMSLTDENTGTPINLSDAGTIVRLKLREVDSTVIKATLVCQKLSGMLLPDGSVNLAAPYDTPGSGGRVFMDWTEQALDTAGEFEGELETTFGDGTIQSVYKFIKFKVREQM